MAAKLYWILLHFSKQKQFYQSKWQQHPRKASLSACCKTSSSPHKHTNRVIIYPSLQCVLLPVERKWNIRICRIWSQSRLKRTSLIFQLGTKTHSFFTALSSCSSSHHYLLPTQNNREDRGRKGGVGGGGWRGRVPHRDSIVDQLWWVREKSRLAGVTPSAALLLTFKRNVTACDDIIANHFNTFNFLLSLPR